jgi:His-Xaa-Ser repeat protein HxsA
MRKSRFLIPSMLAAGFGPHDPAQGAFTYVTTTGSDDPNVGTLMRAFTQDHAITLAQHRSHSSHSSHRSGGGGHSSHMSHTSHRSSTGGYDPIYTPPAEPDPSPSPPPPPPPPPPAPVSPLLQRATPPASDGLPALSGRSKRFTSIVRRVQIALLAQGYYDGRIDGIVGPAMRSGLRRFQESRSLPPTGTITPATLDALMISSESSE